MDLGHAFDLAHLRMWLVLRLIRAILRSLEMQVCITYANAMQTPNISTDINA